MCCYCVRSMNIFFNNYYEDLFINKLASATHNIIAFFFYFTTTSNNNVNGEILSSSSDAASITLI